MRTGTELYDYSPQASSDSRITRLGRFLRRTSLDEAPQLLNVFQGSMSLVGPRPEMPFIVDQYTEKHRQRLDVKPGLTGLWQLSGDRAFLIHENLEYDLYYIQNRNFFMDLAILLHTSIFAMRGI
jgi:lipopolysaccharide/colanic/teichoic acid biosynthesis glycosyltransferase